MSDYHVCACGKPGRWGGRGKQCAACYQRDYRQREGKREAHREAVKRYVAANPDKRREWVNTSQRRRRLSPAGEPDLIALRQASKAVERALAHPDQREGTGGSGQRGGDDAAER